MSECTPPKEVLVRIWNIDSRACVRVRVSFFFILIVVYFLSIRYYTWCLFHEGVMCTCRYTQIECALLPGMNALSRNIGRLAICVCLVFFAS